MKKYLCLFAFPLLTIACTETKPPVCWGKIEIGRHVYDQPIYDKRQELRDTQYLVGDTFKYTWVSKSKFTDLSECKANFN
ncbi:hypothetical protein DDT52_08050 [Brenneria roseae subsp. roseae]|uniref:phage exclusion lipoprotein Cor n=1 Tax=Brenneria roseae TaxID=1509241 RepID=UPI000D60B078|nr:hypothetical protein DDT52_08050 [Brenneria roseae subsp. roseae]